MERNGSPQQTGIDLMFEVRESDRDVAFLRRFLTPELMRDMDMFEYARQGDKMVVTKVSDQQWQHVKDTLLANVGMGSIPVIRVVDADHDRSRQLYLEHVHDGRDLELKYAERTLSHLHQLWGRRVLLQTPLEGADHVLTFDAGGFTRTRGGALAKAV